MADVMHDHAYKWSEKVPFQGSDIVVSWKTPDGATGMTWCNVEAFTGIIKPKTDIPRDALLFGWVYDR